MRISFIRGKLAGQESVFSGDADITVGREEDNALCLLTAGVSRYHARIRRDPATGEWMIGDLGSTNGLKLNGERLTRETPLADGDEVEIGEQCMRISLDAGGARKTAAADEVGELSQAIEVGGLFSGTAPDRTAPPESDSVASRRGGGRRFSTRFYLIVAVCVLAMAGSVAVKLLFASGSVPEKSGAAADKPAGEPATAECVVFFERTVIARDNVFRFALQLENNVATVWVDDLKYHRSIRREIREPEGASILLSALRSSGVWNLNTTPGLLDDSAVSRRLVLGEPGRVLELEFPGEFVPGELERAEAAIVAFVENYGLQTISMTPEELLRQAEDSYRKAEDLYANREAAGSNLREAMLRYRRAMNYLEQFVPRPRLWNDARVRLEEAAKLRKEKLEQLVFEQNRCVDNRDFDGLRRVLLQQMELLDPDSATYDRVRAKLYKVGTLLKGGRGK